MTEIMSEYMKFVPTLDRSNCTRTLSNGIEVEFNATTFFATLLFGDQLTVARARKAQEL